MQKNKVEQSTGIQIVPNWTAQAWYFHLMIVFIDIPVLLPSRKDLLVHSTLIENHRNRAD